MRYRQQGWSGGAAVLAGWLLMLCACSGKPPEERPPVRLNPWVSTAGSVEVGALVDRDTTRLLTLPAPVQLVLDFAHEVELSTLKVYGGRQVEVAVGEARAVDVESPEGWWAQPLWNGWQKTEEVIKIQGGYKSKRRPDITMRTPDGRIYRENVGLQTKKGQPVERERRALDDIERQTGDRPVFTPYNKIE